MLVESPGCILIDRLDIQGVPITPSIDLLMCWNDPQNSGKHFSLVTFPESESESCSVVFNSLQPHGLYSPWNSPGQNTGVGSRFLLQGIFPTQGSNPGLWHCRWILFQLRHQGSPRILEWVAYPFSRGSSWPRNQTGVSCIAGGFFTSWATRKALITQYL